jgi:phosphomevalonate kinase
VKAIFSTSDAVLPAGFDLSNRYPLPLISGLLKQLGSAKFFTKIDLRGVYSLVWVKEGNEWKTSFRTRYGHFEYSVMPFSLTNVLTIFQHMMNDIFREYLDHFVIIYLDDILIYSKNEEEHEHHVRFILEKLRERGFYAK